jgi:hypothetical protein
MPPRGSISNNARVNAQKETVTAISVKKTLLLFLISFE